MGCDIHPYFETRQPNGTWALTFKARPSKWWAESIIENKVDNGSAITVFGPPTEEEIEARRKDWRFGEPTDERIVADILTTKVEEYVKNTPEDQIIERYGHEPGFDWDFYPPEVCERYGEDFFTPLIRNRNYEWFGALSSGLSQYRGGRPVFQLDDRGTPDDCCREIAAEVERYGCDGHSHGWFMVSEILDAKELAHFAQYKWLEKYISDPDNTRMVFFFDN